MARISQNGNVIILLFASSALFVDITGVVWTGGDNPTLGLPLATGSCESETFSCEVGLLAQYSRLFSVIKLWKSNPRVRLLNKLIRRPTCLPYTRDE